jgi:uncharacterized protein with PIN domain
MNTTQTEINTSLHCKWCGHPGPLVSVSDHVHISNAQVAMQHMVWRCPECKQKTATAQWGRDLRFVYKVVEYKRFLRRSTWIAIYDVICAWCGSKATDPAEINVTVANPVSERFRYDLYSCATCEKATAISYLGELRTHCAVRDEVYRALWYLDPE